MGIFDRLWRVVRSNLNHLISQAEDPEKIMEQAILDMQEDQVQLRQAVAQAIATQKRTERQYSQNQTQAEEWYRRAQLALEKGEEGLAREALSRRKTYQESANTLKQQLDQQTQIVVQMKKNLTTLEGKIAETRTKRDMYIARARSAKATEQLQSMMGRLDSRDTSSVMGRMEDKVLQMEARSQAITELSANTLESRFASLESAGDVEAELQAMKAQMAAQSDLPKLPPLS